MIMWLICLVESTVTSRGESAGWVVNLPKPLWEGSIVGKMPEFFTLA
jgi:hypothetical protein